MATDSLPKRFAFTKRAIESLPPYHPQETFHDTKTPHLTIRVGKTRRVFYWYGRSEGRPTRIKLGAFPELTVENARRKAVGISANVAMGEPAVEPAIEEPTLGDLFQTYLEVHAKPYKRSWRQDEYTFNRHLAGWAKRPLSQITRGDLQRLHSDLGARVGQTTANWVRALLSSMWSVAKDHGYWEGDNPVSSVKKFRERDRERYLRAHELPKFFAELHVDPNQDYADYVRLSLFTGARQSNVLAMRWENVDLELAEWWIPGEQFKSGEGQCIPLPTEAVDVLSRRQGRSDSPFVFPGRGVTGHLTRPGKWWERLLKRCGFSERLTMHDLRRTLGSWQAAGGASLLVIGKALGHKDHRSTKVYSRLDVEPVRKSIASATAAITRAANGTGGEHE